MSACKKRDSGEAVEESSLIERLTRALPESSLDLSAWGATKSLLTAVFLMTLGYVASVYSPWYLVPLACACTGAAFQRFFFLGEDCANRVFATKSPFLNDVVGQICLLIQLRPLASLRTTSPAGTNPFKRAWRSLSIPSLRSAACVPHEFSGIWRGHGAELGLASVLLFAAIFFPLVFYLSGFGGFLKYWLLPFLDLHRRIGTFSLTAVSRAPYLLLHPEVRKVASSDSRLLTAVREVTARVPSYNLNKVHASIVGEVTALSAELDSLRRSVHDGIDRLNARGPRFYGRSPDYVCIGYALALTYYALVRHAGHYGSNIGFGVAIVAFGVLSERIRAMFVDMNRSAHATTTAGEKAFRVGPHYFNCIYLSINHVGAVYACYLIATGAVAYRTLAVAFVCYVLGGFGITAGAHRLWAHATYKASFSMRVFLVLLNSMANQGSVLKWSRDHRLHHKHVDTEKDPHNANRGFFYSHIGWLLEQKSKTVVLASKEVYMDDLHADAVVMFQHNNYAALAPGLCFFLPTLVCALWGDSWNGFFVAGVLKYIWTLHCTWFVNSLAHLWGLGSRPYLPDIRPAENLFVAVGSLGEGWHNYHHAYPYDYSTNEYGFLQWNPTTLLIDTAAKFGLAFDRRRANRSSVSDVSSLPNFSLADVANVAKQGASVFAIDGLVYDVMQFEESHPGGPKILKAYYGKDATKAFHGGVHAHTVAAINQLSAYVVGRLAQ